MRRKMDITKKLGVKGKGQVFQNILWEGEEKDGWKVIQ